MKRKNVKIGKKVYYQEPWSGQIIQAEIAAPDEFSVMCNNIVEVNNICRPEVEKSNPMYISRGIVCCPINKLYENLDEIKAAIKEKWKNDVQKYKNKIKNIEDLINFPLSHCFCGEEYTEYEAIQAYKERAKELGFNIVEKQEGV